jgi:hypothetical protein
LRSSHQFSLPFQGSSSATFSRSRFWCESAFTLPTQSATIQRTAGPVAVKIYFLGQSAVNLSKRAENIKIFGQFLFLVLRVESNISLSPGSQSPP